MKNRILLILVVLSLLPVACGGSAKDLGCTESVTALAALQAGAGEIPQNLLTDTPVETGAEFDPNQYFTALPRLSMEPGHTLDYVYTYDGMGGYPTMYAREDVWAPFLSSADLRPGLDNYLNHVIVEDTPEGYLQYAILAASAEQFYLFWHANYNDQQIVCTKQALKDIVKSLNSYDFGVPITAAERRQALAISSVSPVVTLTEQTATVELVTFTRWGGFYRTTFTIDRTFPHFIVDVQQEQLASYNCGISF
jgi:hypothetical protein